jgi:hypothetical protein
MIDPKLLAKATLEKAQERLASLAEIDSDFYDVLQQFELLRTIVDGADPRQLLADLVASIDVSEQDYEGFEPLFTVVTP